jgi:hypothetical protein
VTAPNGDLVIPFHPFTQASLEPVTPGAPETLNVEIFPTDAVILPGHRLRLVLTSGDVPHLMATAPDAANSQGAVNSVNLDPAHPSYVTVPVASAANAGSLASAGIGAGAVGGGACRARLPFSFHVHQNNGRVTHVVVYVDHRRVQSLSGRRIASTVKIVASTVKGKRVVSVRRYRGCVKHHPRTRVRHRRR